MRSIYSIIRNSTVLLSLTYATCFTALAQNGNQALDGGHHEGNGGDGIYVNGQLVMRDFAGSAQLKLVLDNKTFLEQVPGFVDLLYDIARVSPRLALAVWQDLKHTKIYLTEGRLPLLPAHQTGLDIEQVAEVQIAIRNGREIVISQPAFEELAEPKYLLFHESIHGLLQGEGPLHHMRVRSLTLYIRDNRDSLQEETLNRVLEKVGLTNIADSGFLSGYIQRANAFLDEISFHDIVRSLLMSEDRLEDRCYLKEVIKEQVIGTASIIRAINEWRDYSQCPKLNLISEFSKTLPVENIFARFLSAYDVNIPFVYSVKIYNDRRSKEISRNHCNEYASDSMDNLIRRAEKTVRALSDFRDEFPRDSQRAGVRALADALMANRILSSPLRPVTKAQEARATFDGNIKKCSSAFRLRNGEWR